jgi:hypothetical protein
MEMWGLFRNGSARTRRYRKQRKTVETETAPKKTGVASALLIFKSEYGQKSITDK